MASGPITSLQKDGETIGTVTDFIFLGSQITEDDDCSHEIKRCLLLGRKAMSNLDPDAGKDWRWEERGMTEDEMAGWHHWLSGGELEQALGGWWTGKPGVLQSMGLQRQRTWLNKWTEQIWMMRNIESSIYTSRFLHEQECDKHHQKEKKSN